MVDRRSALKAIGSVPLAVAAAGKVSAISANEDNVTTDLWMSDGSVSGYFLEPETAPAGAIILIHEWWGLNDQIRSVVPKFAQAGYLSLAVDLYQGQVAQTPENARKIMGEVHPDKVSAISANEDNVTTDLWMSDGSVSGYFLEPETAPAGAIILIHEWWGLNDQIRSVVPKFAQAGYLSLAVDLYQGQVAQTPENARDLMGEVHPDVAAETLVSWVEWLRNHPKSNGKVGTVGWCFGGGWSLNASIATPVDATVIYYGRCAKGVEEVKNLKGPVMGHFASRDQWINQEMVGGFEKSMDAAGKSYSNFWYEADHGFANPTTTRHDAEDTMLAWTRTMDFFQQHLT